MFDRLTHPVLITLTVPNLKSIRKHDFTLFRQRTRSFLKQHSAWINGGVYSLETTYNRTEKSWHIHVHILADVSYSLPSKTIEFGGMTVPNKSDFFGRDEYEFTQLKMRLEFDWLRLWSGDWGKKIRSDASVQRKAGEAYDFRKWVEATRKNETKEFKYFDGRKYILRSDLTDFEKIAYECRKDWNQKHRRVIDLKPVTDRDGAAFEVLKYITKVAAFSDLPEAVEPFLNAVRGARLIQTFGTWYGVKLDGDANEHDWSEMKCTCGVNDWRRMGVFHRQHVCMDRDGRWRLTEGFDHTSMGTVAKPKIPALDQFEPGEVVVITTNTGE